MTPSLVLLLLSGGCSAPDDADPVSNPDPTTPSTPRTPTETTRTPSDTAVEDTATTTTSAPITDFLAAGPHAVTTRSDTLQLPDCALAFTEYLPDGDPSAPLVVLGHGFQRTQANVAALAEHVASHGMRVATPDYCHARLLDSDPAQNGVDAAALAARLAPTGPTLHAGHSNGGLSAHFAAAADPYTVGVMGLDPVDTDDLVADALVGIGAPMWAIFGEPAACNDDGGLLPALRAAGGAVNGIQGANHCDFEGPTSAGCTFACGQPTGAAPAVQGLLAAFSAWRLEVDPSGADWVLPGGVRYGELVDAGILLEL